MESYIEEKKIEPINILIIFLIGIAAALFLIGSIGSFNLKGTSQTTLIIATIIIYLIALVAFLYPKKIRTKLAHPKPEIIEKEIIKTIEKPIIKEITKYKEKPIIKTIKKEVPKHIIIEKEKIIPPEKKSKYVGSSYNEKYHLRTCRFAGAIKKQYLVEEDERKYFNLRGYAACKVCEPEKD
jgi:hypothetical protein